MHNIKTKIAFRSPLALALAVSASFLVLHNIRFWSDTVNESRNGESCYDEIMFKDVDKSVNAAENDTMIVFHRMGSHGPA